MVQAYDVGANQTTHLFWLGHQQNKNGIVVYSHVERNLAVGEVNSAPYKIEMDLPKILKGQARDS